MVIAGLDKTGKHVVHYKSQNNHSRNFKAYEEKLLTTVEEGDPRNDHTPKQLTERDIWERKIATGDYLDEVRQMPEYKLMFARWVVLSFIFYKSEVSFVTINPCCLKNIFVYPV